MIDDKALVEGLRKTQCPNNMGCNPLVRSCQCAIMDEAADRIEAQAAEIERLKYNGIHSCHDKCERPLCVLERENERLRDLLSRTIVMAETYAEGTGTQFNEAMAEARAALGETK